jgi:hypothetical protein
MGQGMKRRSAKAVKKRVRAVPPVNPYERVLDHLRQQRVALNWVIIYLEGLLANDAQPNNSDMSSVPNLAALADAREALGK